MENYLYFSTGAGANNTDEAFAFPVSRFHSVEPKDGTTTYIHFKHLRNDDTGGTASADNPPRSDIIIITHTDTHDVAGSYHRSKAIAIAMAEAINAAPSGKMIDIIDLDNNIFFGGISEVAKDDTFAVSINRDS